MLKPSDNPPILAEGADQPSAIAGHWWVGHTKARQEKTFAWELHRAGVGYFLPLMQRVMVSGGRKRKVMKPLFTSYLFFCGDEETRYQALATNRLCTVLPAEDQPLLVRELDQIYQALEGEATLDPYPGLGEGRRARVTAGPFQGMEGTVLQWHGVTRLGLEVSMLGQGAAIEIDADLLEPLDEEATAESAGGL